MDWGVFLIVEIIGFSALTVMDFMMVVRKHYVIKSLCVPRDVKEVTAMVSKLSYSEFRKAHSVVCTWMDTYGQRFSNATLWSSALKVVERGRL